LFADIMVALDGKEAGWHALEQALDFARREKAWLHGLHIVSSEEQKSGAVAQAVQAEFDRRCQAVGIPGKLAIEVGDVPRQVHERAWWTDLVVVSLKHPPAAQPLARLRSGFRNLVVRCPRPVLAVPEMCCGLDSALLAYDSSPKSKEALFVAAYLAARWKMALTVVAVSEKDRVASDVLRHAQDYLKAHGVLATFVQESGAPPAAILKVAQERNSQLVLLGGYGFNPVLEAVLGSVVDEVLQKSRKPVLICR
jgi:nucleotide-binding universal stress UspA family protein